MTPQTDEVAADRRASRCASSWHDGAVTDEIVEGPGWTLRAAVYRAEGHRIWGATARTLAMFASVLQQAEADSG